MPDLFYEKKRLLVQRDDLLQDIGLTMFMSGDLPEGFQDMPREFAGMELLVRQLGDRYRVMKEERDRHHIDYTELINKIAKIEGAYKKKQAPLRHDVDELKIKIRFITDQQAEGKRINDEQLAELEAQAGRLSSDIAKLENEKNTKLEHLHAEIDPLERRLEKLDRSIRKVEQEELQLSVDGNKRLQDLGNHYYRLRKDEAFYGDKYDQLDELRDRLAISKQAQGYKLEQSSVRPRREHNYWLYVMLLGVFLGVWIFRTTYEEQDVSMSAIAANYLRDQADTCLYLNLEKAPPAMRDQALVLSSLPGGQVFLESDQNRLSEFVIARNNQEQLQFCGIGFREAPTRFSTRLAQAGWVYAHNERGFLSMTKDDWLWLALNSRTYMLLPKGRLEGFLAAGFGAQSAWYLRRDQFTPYGYNEALLQGFGRYEMRLEQNQFLIRLTSNERQVGLTRRQQRLAMLQQRQEANSLKLDWRENGLWLEGNRDQLPATAFQRSDTLRDTISRLCSAWSAQAPKQPALTQSADSMIPPMPTPTHVAGRPSILVFAHTPMGLALRSEIAANHPITGMAYVNKNAGLLLTDVERGLLSEYRFDGRNLRLQRSRNLVNHPANHRGFRPSRLSLTPDEQFALVFEQRPDPGKRPQMMLVRLSDLEPVLVTEFPEGVSAGHSSAWDTSGATLFLGVQGRVRRNGTALGALVYRREGDVLNLLRFIDVPAERDVATRVSALFFDDNQNDLLLLRKPSDELVRFRLDRAVNQNLEWVLLDQGRHQDIKTDTIRQGRLLPTRDGGHAVATVDTAADTSVIHLIGLDGEALRLEDQLPLSGVPAAMTAVPMHNQFWLALPERKTLGMISIYSRQLSYRSLIQFDDHQPHDIVCDQWGDFVFVASNKDDLR